MADHLSGQHYEVHLLLAAGRMPEANTVFDHVLAEVPASTGNRTQRATALVDRAVTAWRLHRIPLALELAAEGWTELEGAAPEGPLAARALGQLGDLLEGIGSSRASLDMLRLAVQVARSASDPAMLAHCLQRLAGCLNFRAIDGPRESAEAVFREAQRLSEEGLALPGCKDHVRRALLATHGRSLAGLGALRRAEQVAAQALELGEQADDRRSLAVGNWVLALVRRQQGRFTEARALASSAVADAEQLDDDNLLLRLSLDLAEICAELDDDVGESVALRRSVTAGRTIMKTLQAGLGQALEQRRLAVKAQRIAEAAQEAAARDPLTGLANRLGLERTAPLLLERTAAEGRVPWLALVDIDWFKRVNDEAGHAAGDAVLREIAQLLRKECRTEDLVVRWAGDEFVVLLVDGTEEGRDAGPVLAERIRATVEGHDWTTVLGTARRPTVSIGVAAGSAKLDRLFAAADIALYRAKRRGRNRVEVHPLLGGTGAGKPP